MKQARTTIVEVNRVKTMTFVALMTAVCCILGPMSIPIGPVPISLGVLAVYLCVYALGMKLGAIAVGLYLLLGLFGLPVFSGYAGGPGKMFGPTGGYLIGFLFLALISGYFIDRFPARRFYLHIVGMILGLLVCYLFGTVWFMILTGTDFVSALGTCVIPFLPVDAVKMVLAVILGNTVRKALSLANLMNYWS